MDKSIKPAILEKVIELVSGKLKSLGESLNGTNNAINDAPGAMQSHSDTTRSQLTSVMNVAQKSFSDKSEELDLLKRFASKDITKIVITESQLGAIIILRKDNKTIENYFLLPGGSGTKVEYEGNQFICLTAVSPLGQALLKKVKGQFFLLKVGKVSQNVEVIDII